MIDLAYQVLPPKRGISQLERGNPIHTMQFKNDSNWGFAGAPTDPQLSRSRTELAATTNFVVIQSRSDRRSVASAELIPVLGNSKLELPFERANPVKEVFPMSRTPIVYVVDADISIRESVEALIRTAGWQAETFASARDFLSRPRISVPSCLILDAFLPDMTGLELQERIGAERSGMPIIFLSGRCDVQTTVKAMKAGAMEFMVKPFDPEVLLNAIRQAIKRSETVLGRETELQTLRYNFGSLTSREREVMTLVASGFLNKQVGGELGISEITVKAHRGNVMRKMRADSFADLVSMALRLRVVRSLAAAAA